MGLNIVYVLKYINNFDVFLIEISFKKILFMCKIIFLI